MTLEDLIPDVLADVPGCPRETIRHHLRRAVITAARETLLDDRELDRFAVPRKAERADFSVPKGMVLVRLTRVRLHVPTLDETIEPEHHVEDGEIVFAQPLEHAGTLEVRGALEPIASFDQIPAVLTRFTEAICDQARYRLLRMPNQSWSDSAAAAMHRTLYEDRAVDMRTQRAVGKRASPIRTSANPFH